MRHLEWPLAVRMHEGEDNQFQSVAISGNQWHSVGGRTMVKMSESPQKNESFIARRATCRRSARSARYDAIAPFMDLTKPTPFTACNPYSDWMPPTAPTTPTLPPPPRVSGRSILSGVVSKRIAANTLKGIVGSPYRRKSLPPSSALW